MYYVVAFGSEQTIYGSKFAHVTTNDSNLAISQMGLRQFLYLNGLRSTEDRDNDCQALADKLQAVVVYVIVNALTGAKELTATFEPTLSVEQPVEEMSEKPQEKKRLSLEEGLNIVTNLAFIGFVIWAFIQILTALLS